MGPLGRLTRRLGREGKRIAIAAIGVVVLLIGIAMIVLPGPALLVIPAGLALLATQFDWAQKLLDRLKDRAGNAVDRVRDRFPDRVVGMLPGDAGVQHEHRDDTEDVA